MTIMSIIIHLYSLLKTSKVMSWYYLDIEGNTKGPVTAMFILSKYNYKTGINANTHLWNELKNINEWSELQNVYSFLIDDTIDSIINGIVTKNILSIIMNPYDTYIYKKKTFVNSLSPIGKAIVEIEYKGYLANEIEIENTNTSELQYFIQNRESIQLGIKKNAYGLEKALYKIHVGEECLIYIPYRLAYGLEGIPNLIPSKTDILFILTVHKIQQQGHLWQNVKFEKWSKMKAKWNTQKQNTNMLYIAEDEEDEEDEKQYLSWDKWLIEKMAISQEVISKLSNAGMNFKSWDELHAIEDDVDELAKELGISTIEKIKLKAMLGKLPPMNDLPLDEVNEVDEDDPKYLKTQILLLKEENLRLNKLADENGSKQQVMESWDNLFTKDIELQKLQKEFDDECKKYQDKDIELSKLKKLIQLADNQNYIDIQNKLIYNHNNYCDIINNLINKIETSTSTLDSICIDAINNIKTLMNKNLKELNVELQNKKRIFDENKKNIKQLKQIKLIENVENKNDKYDNMVIRIDNVDELTKKRQSIKITLNRKINILLTSINNGKVIILSKISELCLNKYNQLFYKYFIEEMSMNFYDCKLISSQFVLNYNNLILMSDNDSVLVKGGEKIIFQIPLTTKLLKIVRNKNSEINLFYDIICLDFFINNMVEFEQNIIYNDPLTFASIIGINLTNSKHIQNIIKSNKTMSLYNNGQNNKQNNQIHEKIAYNLRYQAKIFVDNLTYLIVTGYAMLIINACYDKMDYIELLCLLCLLHPTTKSPALNKENLSKMLKNIQTKQLKELVNDYFNDFGKLVFMEKIINNARGIKSLC
eukprot:541139_1